MATLEEIEKRLKVLEDIEEIKQMHINYILALNHQNFEEMIDCFTEDAIVEYQGRHEGKEEIAKFFRAMAERQREHKVWKGGQILIHPVISVEGDEAKGYWTWYRLIGMPQKFTSKTERLRTFLPLAGGLFFKTSCVFAYHAAKNWCSSTEYLAIYGNYVYNPNLKLKH